MPIIIDATIKMTGVMPALTKLNKALNDIKKQVNLLNSALAKTVELAGAAGSALSGLRSSGGSGGGGGGRSGGGGTRPGYNRGFIGPSVPRPPFAGESSFIGPLRGPKTSRAAAAAAGFVGPPRGPTAAYTRPSWKAGGFIGPPAPPPPHSSYTSFIGPPAPPPPYRGKKPPVIKTPKTFMQNLMSAFMRSRVGAKGGLMPLVMDIAKILGPEITAAIAILTAQFQILKAALQGAVEALGMWRNSLVMGGGTPGQARAAIRFGEFGIDVGGIGKNLMNGTGPIAAGGAGVNPFGGPFGDNNYNEKGLKVLDWVRKAKNFQEARRRAETAGSPEAANAYLLDNDVYKNLRNEKSRGGEMKGIKDEANFKANVALLTDSLNDLKVAIGGPIVNVLSGFFSGIAKAISLIPTWALNGLGHFIVGIMGPLGAVINLISLLSELFNKLGFGGAQSKQDKSIDKFDKAVDRFGDVVANNDYNTGGPRAQSATPGRLDPNKDSNYGAAHYGML